MNSYQYIANNQLDDIRLYNDKVTINFNKNYKNKEIIDIPQNNVSITEKENDIRFIRLWKNCPGYWNISTDIDLSIGNDNVIKEKNSLEISKNIIKYEGPFKFDIEETSGIEVPEDIIAILSTKPLKIKSELNIKNLDENFDEFEDGCELLIIGGPKYLPCLSEYSYDDTAKHLYFIDIKNIDININVKKYKSIIIRGSNCKGIMKYTY